MDATIEVENGLYRGIINGKETIAISDDIHTVAERLKHADRNIRFTVVDKANRKRFKTIEGYTNSLLPRIYRIANSQTDKHGLIIAIDSYKAGDYSRVQLFYDSDEAIKHIKRKQRNDDRFYLQGRQPYDGFKDEVGGIKSLDVPESLRDTKHLRQVIEKRQKAGSHDAYIKQARKKPMIKDYEDE